MRIHILLLSAFIFHTILFGQAPPEAFNYSGAARDINGNPISEQAISLEFTILKGSPTGMEQYREHHSVSTDKYGVFNCVIGKGSIQSGIFADIEWGNDSYFLRIGLDINGGTEFVEFGTTQLISVPYALYAKSAGKIEFQSLSISNDTIFLTNGGFVKLPEFNLGYNGYIGPPIFTLGNGVTDIDGNTYKTIKIGNQEWMAENLKVSRYRNGNPIPNVIDSVQWDGLTTGAWCHVMNDPSNESTYGKLYNWYAVNSSRNLCPANWHVPTSEDYMELTNFIDPYSSGKGESRYAGGFLKSNGTLQKGNGLWQHPNNEATNASGFSAHPAGNRDYKGALLESGFGAQFWSATEFDAVYAYRLSLSSMDSYVSYLKQYKSYGLSVRCIKD